MRGMTEEPTRAEIERVLQHVRIRKRVKEKSGPHILGDCPSCGKAKHFYANEESGLWDCKRCGEAGNLWQLADLLGVRVRERRLVKSVATMVMQGIEQGAPKMPKRLRDAKGLNLDTVTQRCEALFSGDEPGAKVRAYLEGRGFTEDTIRHFKLCKAVVGGGDSRELALGIPYIEEGIVPLMKMRNLAVGKEKRRYGRTKGSDSRLFNLEGVRDRKQVILVEGELDAISLWQLGITNVASTSLGAKGDIPGEWKELLADADDIVIWYDDDQAGEEATEGLITALGSHRCRIASLEGSEAQTRMCGQLKDANDLLQVIDGKTIEHDEVAAWARQIVDAAKGLENTIIVEPSAFVDYIANEIVAGEKSVGIPTGWASMDKLMKGWRTKELTVVTGHTSHGKSTWLTAACDMLAESGEPVLLSAFEGGPAGVARKIFQRKFGYPISSITTDAQRLRAMEMLKRLDENPVYLIDAYGRTSIATIIDALTYARHRLGVRYVMLDHLHYFLKRPAGIDEREYIDEVTMRLVDLTRELDIHIWLVCHPAGRIDGGTIPGGGALKGSSSIKQNADNGITVFRAMDMLGDPTPRKVKLRDDQGKRVEVELSPLNALLYVWKTRHDDALTGSAIFDFSPRDLSYRDPNGRSGATVDDETPVEDKDPFDELPF